jgi:uncharacterized repeat protein (TIGR01451 family)/fimbrial isopeptide formation D2 family protein
MSLSMTGSVGAGRSWIKIQLLTLLLLLGAAFHAHAEDCVADYGGVLDGATTPAPSNLNIDGNCTVRNFSRDNPLISNIAFFTSPGQTDERWLVIFDDVYHTGSISCAVVHEHKFWLVNGSFSEKINEFPACANMLVPVERIDKQSPSPYASIGVPFTYRLNIPVLYDPATGSVIIDDGSDNDLHTVVITDDLSVAAIGVDLTVVGTPTVTWRTTGAPVPHTYTNVGNVLTFAIDPANTGVQIPAGQQIAIDIPVVLNNNPAVNTLGKTFTNTANWSFGRAIDLDDDGTVDPDEFFSPLPGDRGVSQPMTIAGPDLVMTKSGTSVLGAASINLGEWGVFTLDVVNNGQFGAWNVTVLDQLPDGPNGGMCDLTPEITGVTLGGTPLTPDTQYTLSYTAAPTCQLSISLLDAAGAIAPGAHLIVNYRTKLDSNSQNGVTLTNIAGATRWFNDASTSSTRVEVNDPLTNGTPGTTDNEDDHTLSVLLSGFFFEKSVRDVTSGANPAIIATPGDVLHYTLRLQATDTPFTNVTFRDQMPPDFVAGSLNFTSLPPGVTNNSNPATGLVDLRGINVPAGTDLRVEFDVTLLSTLANGHIVQNQAQLLSSTGGFVGQSDDPNVNGQADPAVANDEDPTRVRIAAPPVPPTKALISPASGVATIGEELVYRITVPGAPRNAPMYDVQVTDALNANLEYVSATVTVGGVVNGPGVVNSSTGSQLNIAIGQIGAGQQALIDVRVRVRNVLTAQQGLAVSNTASFTYSDTSGGTPEPALTTNAVMFRIVEPTTTIAKTANRATAVANDIIRYTVTLTTASGADTSEVFDVSLTDSLSPGLVYAGNPVVTGAGNTIGAPAVTGDGSTGAPQTLVWSLADGSANIDIPAGTSVTVSYDVRVLGSVLPDQNLTNSAVARWTGINGANAGERTGADGIGLLNDYVTAPATTTVITPGTLPSKALTSPANALATIGQEVVYTITVPSAPSSSTLYNVTVTDPLDANLQYVSATVTGVASSTNTSTPTQMNIAIPQIPAGQQATIELHALVRNVQSAQQGVQVGNTVSYTYATSLGGALLPARTSPAATFTIVEPTVTVAKTGNTTAVSGGSTVRYTVTLTAAGGANTSDVFDTGLTDTLAEGLVYAGNPVVTGTGNTIGAPVITGTGATGSPQKLVWSLEDGNANIDIPAGTSVTVSYDVSVLSGLAAMQSLANSVYAQWTSLDGASTAERNGVGCPAITQPNDYCTGPASHTVITDPPVMTFEKTVLTGSTARPGDVVRYRLRLVNQSNVTFSGFSIVDDIDALNNTAMFVPGTLTLASTLPAGATNNSNPAGGGKGTGLLDIANLSLGPAASATDNVVIEFTAQLVSVIANSTIVLDQARVTFAGTTVQLSDDPAQSGNADPTPITIQSAPVFRVQKVSNDVTGDPNVLLAGETLRYTITVKNVGTDNAVNVVLRDQVPANTTYVAGSTTLNGATVADVGGLSPLVNDLVLHSPADPTPGTMPADATSNTANVATITFDVVVDPTVVDGTVISNQGFVSSVPAGIADRPSDDPTTSIVDDPTRDVVGSVPLLFADKRVALQGDLGSPGVVDPGDVLRYTITVQNTGALPATGLRLIDAIPANTTYVSSSTSLNGTPLADVAGGAPLVAGIDLGALAAGASAVVQFDLRVNAGTPAGTVISNQAVVQSVEVPDLLTDGDGNPATGPEPTVVVVGNGQQITIAKTVAVVGGGPAVAGATLEYTVRVANVASVPAYNVVLTDDLAALVGQLNFVAGSATLNGSTAGVTVVGATITADDFTVRGPLPAGQTAVLRFRAVLDAGLAIGTTVTNTATVRWNTPEQTASASVSIDVGGVPGQGALNGAAWHDVDFDDTQDAGERALSAWAVELYRDGTLVHTATTDTAGAYRITGLPPNTATGERYELRFRAPGAGARTALLGVTASPFTNGLQRITDVVVTSGGIQQGLNLPIDPNGVVYNAVARAPIAGAVLTMLDAGSRTPLPASCFDDAAQQGQVTLGQGYYKFDVNFSDPACASGGDYLIDVTAPGSTYVAGYSQIIPPTSDPATAPLAVPSCPLSADDAIPATAQHCEAQPSEFAPAIGVPARSAGTRYHVHLRLDGSQPPGSSQIYNNHIPLDPDLSGAVSISKTTPLMNVTRGQLVPYTITVNNTSGLSLTDVRIVDRYPAGFVYVEGSARVDGVPTEPVVAGRELSWSGLGVAGATQRTVQLLLAVGAGVSEGEYVNRAQAVYEVTGNALSGEATATVRVLPDPTFDCTDVTGKVFDDANRNGTQDDGERGLPGVRLVTTQGLVATTDAHGRYHVTCAVTPDEARGSNFVLKLDDRTLPSGFRMSTKQTQIQRATRGKALRMNFGASIYRVVGLDVADPVFEPGTTEIRIQWRPRIDMLLEELRKAPATLRLSYLADVEDEELVARRMKALEERITSAWEAMNCCYSLTIEPEVFWRLGAPPKQPVVRVPDGR